MLRRASRAQLHEKGSVGALARLQVPPLVARDVGAAARPGAGPENTGTRVCGTRRKAEMKHEGTAGSRGELLLQLGEMKARLNEAIEA